jgi:type IV secretory pathway TrbD component
MTDMKLHTRRTNRVFRSLHKPLTYLGVERTLFYLVCVGAVGAFNLFNSMVAGIAVFIGGFAFGRWVTSTDPAFLRILVKSERYKLHPWRSARNRGADAARYLQHRSCSFASHDPCQLGGKALSRFANLVMRSHAQSTISDLEAEIGEAVDFDIHVERQPGRHIIREVLRLQACDWPLRPSIVSKSTKLERTASRR